MLCGGRGGPIPIAGVTWPSNGFCCWHSRTPATLFVYLGYETETHCEAAGEEIKALSTFRVLAHGKYARFV